MDTTYRAAKRAEISARRAANDSFLATTARDEIAFGRSELAASAFYGMQTANIYFDSAAEHCTDGRSPCDLAQTERLNHVRRGDGDCGRAFARYSVRLHASTQRARAAARHTATPDGLTNAAVADAIYSSGVACDSGVRNTRDICDYLAGRVVVDGDLPLPAPAVDLSLVIRDLPDRQRSVAKRLMAGDSAADIARADGVSRVAITLLVNKIRRALLAADPSLCPA